MVSFLVTNDINIQIVSILKLVAVRHPMRHHIVDRGANAFSELMKADSRGVCIIFYDVVMHYFIDVIQCHPYLGFVHRLLERPCP